jgi:site-specific recombinase XerD
MRKPETLRDLIPLVLNSVESNNTRRVYASQLEGFLEWWDELDDADQVLNKATVQSYLEFLKGLGKSASSRNQALTVLRRLTDEAVDAGMTATTAAHTVGKIKAVKRRGRRTGTWLTQEQAVELVAAPDAATLKGKRDRVLLGLLLECGLRREEAAAVQVRQVQERDGRMVLVDLRGKGGRLRTVPVHWRTAGVIADWIAAANITKGPLLQHINKADRLEDRGEGISTTAIYKQVRAYAERLGVEVRPHDLRRTFGKLSRQGGAEIDQIQATLGHGSLRTTELYLGDNQKLKPGEAPADKIDLGKKKK